MKDNDLLEAASQLAKLLDLSSADLETLLQKKGEVKKITTKPPKPTSLSEYIFRKDDICNTCSTKETTLFHMRKRGAFLLGMPINSEKEFPLLEVRLETSTVPFCKSCMENLTLLSKEDLVILLLEEKRRKVETFPTRSFEEFEDFFFRSTQVVPKRRRYEEERTKEAGLDS